MAVIRCPECHSRLTTREQEDRKCDSCGSRLTTSSPPDVPPNDDLYSIEDNPPPPRPKRPIDDVDPEREARLARRRRRSLEEDDIDEPHPAAKYQQLMKEAKSQASTTLFIIAGLMLVCGTIGVFVLGNQQNAAPEEMIVAVALVVGMAIVFAMLGTWALFQPTPPAIIGLIFFIGITILDFAEDPMAAAKGIIFRIIMVILLIKAIGTAMKAREFAPARQPEDDYDD